MTATTPARLLSSALVGAAVLAAGLTTATPAVAAPESVTVVGPDRQLTLTGRGFGHGRGMSQWGAYGAADAGRSWRQILSFYYPRAALRTQTDQQMRVWISRDHDGVTQVPAQPGLRVAVGNTVTALPTGPSYTAWRALASGRTVALQYRDAAGVWKPRRVAPATSVAFLAGDTVAVTMPGGQREEFPGRVSAVLQGTRVATIAVTTTERYLRGVVPNEMPASWHRDAVAAQSVAARTYASSYRARRRAAGSIWDVCDTVTCQVYRGTATSAADGTGRRVLDDARATAAIAATAGSVLTTPSGSFVHAEFSASNGGYTVDGGAFAQVAKPDPYDGRMKNPNSAWTRTVPTGLLEKEYRLGALKSLQVLARDSHGALGGRTESVRLVGTTRSVVVDGAAMRRVLGLRSEWFTITTTPAAVRTATTVPAGSTTLSAEWSGDRVTDRLRLASGRLYLEKGTSAGRFSTPVAVTGAPSALARLIGVGDVDGDRRADVIAVDRGNRLVVLRGTGRGSVASIVRHGGGWGAFRVISVRDVDRDGRVDLLASYPDGRRLLYAGTSKGVFVGRGPATGS